MQTQAPSDSRPEMAQQTQAHRQKARRIVDFFETLTPAALAQLPNYYSPQARFKDPFNDVTGVPEIEKIFHHMYLSLREPHFVITGQVVDGAQIFLMWEFRFHMKRFDTRAEQTIEGSSYLQLNAQGLITLHRDYWDAAQELYEKLPVLGSLIRWLKRRAMR